MHNHTIGFRLEREKGKKKKYLKSRAEKLRSLLCWSIPLEGKKQIFSAGFVKEKITNVSISWKGS
jgi:hypothetical protein